MDFSTLATEKNRWYALIVIALGLAIVIIDNTVLNVSVPYMLSDLHTSFSAIEWAISGYALTIAAVLITVGRLGDIWGYKRMFILGVVLFIIGSFIASIAPNAAVLVFGRAIVQALGAAITLTSALSLLAATFEGKERAIAFGIWGSVAGASATIGPLLGGFLTTFYSWRWSLRINVIIGIIAILGSVFIMEHKGQQARHFDWGGTILSSSALFFLVFGFIEGYGLGWISPNVQLPFWPLPFSIIPAIFLLAAILLAAFIRYELWFEKRGSPLLKMDMFRSTGFSLGLVLLAVFSLGQFGTFFILPIYLENVLSLDALHTGFTLLTISVGLFFFGTISGFLAQRINVKWIVITGLGLLALGRALLVPATTAQATVLSLAPSLIIIGIGFGLGSSQLNNIIMSSVPRRFIGEASATSITMRQIGSALGIAIIGAVLAASLSAGIAHNVHADSQIPAQQKASLLQGIKKLDLESGQVMPQGVSGDLLPFVKKDVNNALSAASRDAFVVAFGFTFLAFLLSFFLPKIDQGSGGHAAEG